MKARNLLSVTILTGLLVVPATIYAQGTAFTYQGRLQSGANAANGSYDMTFALYNASSGGSQVGSTITDTAIGVSNGLFTVIVDFGGVFNGSSYWLQIGVRSNGVGSYNPLSPRQELTPTPYAITAENVNGLVSASQVTGTLNPSLFPIPLDLSGSTGVPLLEADQAGNGDAIFGSRTSGSGTAAGVHGATASTDGSANAVYGVVSSTSPGGFSAAVRGQNNGTGGLGIGVYGSQAGSGWGVYGTAVSGVGVEADGGSGTGVFAEGGTGMSAIGLTADGLDAYAETTSGIGALGSHLATTGTAAGVEGTTASTDGSANAVYGQVSSTSPGGFSAGVRGENDGTGGNGIGVYGTQNGFGWGVYGYTPGGAGVYGYSPNGLGVEAGSVSNSAVYASSSYADGVDAYSSTAIGVNGTHTGSTGTAAGVQGTTFSQSSLANAVYGLVSSTSPGGSSAGVRGENDGTGGLGIGVYGSQNGSGWGVYGETPSGLGVYGSSSSGTGVEGESGTGTGVYAYSGGSALTIGGGTIHVSGAGIGTSTAAFIHRATTANTGGDTTTIDNPQCNGDPNAILIVTQNWNPASGSGNYNTHHVGVWYTGSNWAIFNEDGTAMAVNTAYNVLVIKN
jgi:hypothetical protein